MPESSIPPTPAYVLTDEDQRDLQVIAEQLAALNKRISVLDDHAYHSDMERLFPLGTGGHRITGRQRKRFDASFEKARKLAPLYEQRTKLERERDAILGGQRAQRRQREAEQAQRRVAMLEKIQQAEPGDFASDSAYGLVRVVRRNPKSLAIETASGYRERRPFSLIEIVWTEAEIVEWFARQDQGKEISAGIQDMVEQGSTQPEMVQWLQEETRRRNPKLANRLLWLALIHHTVTVTIVSQNEREQKDGR